MENKQSKYLNSFILCLKYTGLLICYFFYNSGLSQELINAELIGHTSNDEISDLISDHDCNLIFGGSFRDMIEIEFETLQSQGESDVFIGSFDGMIQDLIAHGGGSKVDELVNLGVSSTGDIIATGTFIQEATFQNQSVQAGPSTTASFITKYDEDNLVWIKTLNGNSYEAITDVCIDADDNIYLFGYYNQNLIFEQSEISSDADEAIFVLKLSETGELIWFKSFGSEGETRIVKAAIAEKEGQIIIVGNLQGKVVFNEDTISSNTSDKDVFLASITFEGDALWGKKAGGVYEDLSTDITLDVEENIFITGRFHGLIKIDDLQIETASTTDENIFVIKTNKTGDALWARSIGESSGTESGLSICTYDQNSLLIAGTCTGNFSFDGNELITQGDAVFHPFIASISNDDGISNWIYGPKESSGIIVPRKILKTNCDKIYVGGAINGTIRLDDGELVSRAYDGFFLEVIPPEKVSNENHSFVEDAPIVYPNPNHGIFNISNAYGRNLKIYLPNGKLVFLEEHIDSRVEVALPSGVYYYEIEGKIDGKALGKLIIQN